MARIVAMNAFVWEKTRSINPGKAEGKTTKGKETSTYHVGSTHDGEVFRTDSSAPWFPPSIYTRSIHVLVLLR